MSPCPETSCLGFRAASIHPLPPCSLKTSVSSQSPIQVETVPCGLLDSERTCWNFPPVDLLTHIKLLQNSEYSPPCHIFTSIPCKGRGDSKAARGHLTWSHPKLDRWRPKVVRFKYFIFKTTFGEYNFYCNIHIFLHTSPAST